MVKNKISFIFFMFVFFFLFLFFLEASRLVIIPVYAAEKELLFDSWFKNGVVVGYANTYPNQKDEECISRWRNRLINYDNVRWQLIEISERFYFCDNLITPWERENEIAYISPNAGKKQLVIDKTGGKVRMFYDTSWEWRGGCNLCKPWTDVTSQLPQYGDPLTNWPHFLIQQVISSSYKPNIYPPNLNSIPFSERVYLGKYERLVFTGQFRWNESQKARLDFNCPSGDWKPNSCEEEICASNCENIPDHALFYVGFTLWRQNPTYSGENNPNVIYALLPLIYTNNGEENIGGNERYLMGDQFGDRTFFAKFGEGATQNVRKLIKNQWVNLEVDVNQFGRETLYFINPAINEKDYFLFSVMIGWEIWGGYRTDIEFQNISLKSQFHSPRILFLTYPGNDNGTDLNSDGKVNGIDFGKMLNGY